MKKRRVDYPPARTANRPVRGAGLTGDRPMVRSTVAEINLQALDRRDDLNIGDYVRIGGDGLYAGEIAVVESIVGGLIPAAGVRTEAGKTRRVRAIDLQRVPKPQPNQAGADAPIATEASAPAE
jgi:hypothetical protein